MTTEGFRKQLALFQERKVKPRRADDSTRWMMAALRRMFPWRDALVNVVGGEFVLMPRLVFGTASDNVAANDMIGGSHL